MNIFPALRYKDASAAIDWLKDAFGFQEAAVYRGDDGIVRHAQLKLGTGMVMLGQYDGGSWLGGRPMEPLASSVSIYVVVGDPDAHYARAKKAGAAIVRDITDEDYGSREYSARDLEGNLWSFGTYDPYK
jgi:uncharacterized glyoxalase superfamily protein PhnB